MTAWDRINRLELDLQLAAARIADLEAENAYLRLCADVEVTP